MTAIILHSLDPVEAFRESEATVRAGKNDSRVKVEEKFVEDPISANASKSRRGRPRGTGYRKMDEALHGEMRQLLEAHTVPSLTSAAKIVVSRAYGSGTQESKISRLVRSYPFPRA